MASNAELAQQLSPALVQAAEEQWKKSLPGLGLVGLGTSLKPSDAIARLSSAGAVGVDVFLVLERKRAITVAGEGSLRRAILRIAALRPSSVALRASGLGRLLTSKQLRGVMLCCACFAFFFALQATAVLRFFRAGLLGSRLLSVTCLVGHLAMWLFGLLWWGLLRFCVPTVL